MRTILVIAIMGILFAFVSGCTEGEAVMLEKDLPPRANTVDILFVVDNSNSMCEEQKHLQESFDQFVQLHAQGGADFRLAVVDTDMTSIPLLTAEQAHVAGRFRQKPGTYVENLASCTEALPDLSACAGKTLPKFLESADYAGLDTAEGLAALQADFGCMALTGIDGDPVEMGLEAMRQALSRPDQQDFLRPGSRLAVVFVTDENDCSDGTQGSVIGQVYPYKDNGCEWNRNIEDSCLLPDPNLSLSWNGLTQTAREWCLGGDREALNALAADLAIKCELDPMSSGVLCTNKLVARQEYYDFLVNKVALLNDYGIDAGGLARAADDIIIATIINRDAAVRYNSSEMLDGNWCDGALSFATAGTQGYRYELFAQMFPAANQAVAPICDNQTGQAVNFAPALGSIAQVIVGTFAPVY